jgi:hypothetical protein
MSLLGIALRVIGGACVVALSFWITLKLLDYSGSTTSTQAIAPENGGAGGSTTARRTIRLFDERSSRVDDLAVAWNAAEGPDGSHTAILLEDRSKIYGSIMQEVPVGNDDRTHTVSIDFKADTSPIGEIVMVYQGGGQQKTYYAFVQLKRSEPGYVANRRRTNQQQVPGQQLVQNYARRGQQRVGKYEAARAIVSTVWRSRG